MLPIPRGWICQLDRDILLFVIPNSWKQELNKQGAHPDTLTPGELMAKLEQLEETAEGTSTKNTKKDDKSKGSSEKDSKNKTVHKKSTNGIILILTQ